MLYCLLAQLNSNGPWRTQQKGVMESTLLNKNSGDMTDQGPFWRATHGIVWFHCSPCHLTQFLIDVGCVNVMFLWYENWVLTRKTKSPENPTWLLILSDPLNIICCLSYWSLTGRASNLVWPNLEVFFHPLMERLCQRAESNILPDIPVDCTHSS